MGNPAQGGTATASPMDAVSPLPRGPSAGGLSTPSRTAYSPQLRNLSCSMESAWIGASPSWSQPSSSPNTQILEEDERNVQAGGPPETEAQCPLLDWGCVSAISAGQVRQLQDVAAKGVLWVSPADAQHRALLELHYLGDVDADGNCLFTAIARSLAAEGQTLSAPDVRLVAVQRFLADYKSGALDQQQADLLIRNLYSPNLENGWGVHVLQEVKLLAKRIERAAMDAAIAELVATGMGREAAAGSILKERCTRIEDGPSWAAYMRCGGGQSDEYDVVTLVYTEEGLLTVEENREGRGASFGDDIVLESLATEWKREIFVMQSHPGATSEDAGQLFFLPHAPRHPTGKRPHVEHAPLFLFMKGTDWCAGGSDHYEPIYAKVRKDQSGKPACVL